MTKVGLPECPRAATKAAIRGVLNITHRQARPEEAPLGRIVEIDWSAPLDARVAAARSTLASTGFVVLKSYADAARVTACRAEFDGDSHKMTRSGASKYALKHADIEHLRIVADLRHREMLAFVNGVAEMGRSLLPSPLLAENVQIGYSILPGSADAVGYHFDHLNFAKVIVPILMPPTPSYLGPIPMPWGAPDWPPRWACA